MRKGWIIAIVIGCIALFAIGVLIGVYFYKEGQVQDSNVSNRQLAEELKSNNENEAISTSAEEEKLSPNCTIIERQYFKGCDHLIKNIKDIPEELINSSKEQVEEKYNGWTLDSFSSNEVIVSQEKDGYCDQHYVIREHNGVLGIYTLNEDKTEEFKEDTEIATRYLPDEDIEKLKEGIKAIGDDQLHRVLGDFE